MTKKLYKKMEEIRAVQRNVQRKWTRAEKKCEDLRKLEMEAWKKYFPKFKEQYEKLPKTLKGIWGDSFIEGLKDTEIQLVDSYGQKLDFRVGPVFGKKGVWNKPGLWIGFQRHYMSSSRDVQLVISPEMWLKLNHVIEKRFKEFNPKSYGSRKVVKVKK